MSKLLIISLSLLLLLTGCGSKSSSNNNPGTANTAPVASNVFITDDNGGNIVVGDTLTGHYSYTDADDDNENASSYRWMRNGSVISGATSITYTLVQVDEGEIISFEVTVIATTGELTGSPVTSSSITVSNASSPQPFDSTASYSHEIYADGSASSNGNGSLGQPFDNIPDAITAARNAGSGSRIHIAAGTYPAVGSHANLQGQADAPIALVAEGNVIIDAGNSGLGMSFSNARYLVIDGLTIQNTAIHGLNIDDGADYSTPSEYIVLRNMHFRDIGSGGNNDCLKMSGVDNFYIEDSEFEGCNQGEAIDMVGCHDGVITASYFHDVLLNGVQTKGGSSDILIHGNRFIDIPVRSIMAGGNTGDPHFRPITASYEAERITISANLFVRTGQTAVVYSGCNGCIVANNTIIEPNGSVFWAVEENTTKGPGQNGYFLNNIVVFNDADLSNFSFFNSNGLSLINTFTIDANLWFAQDNGTFSSVPNGYAFPMSSNGIIQDDPMLDVNFRLTLGSPAIAQGITVPGGVVSDFDGIAYSIPPSIGAFSSP